MSAHQSGHSSNDLETPNHGVPQPIVRLSGGGQKPQTLSSLKACHLVAKRPKKKLSHLYFGPVSGGERQDLIRQPRPSAAFVERRQFKNAFADQLFPNVIKMGFSRAKASGPKADRGRENLAIAFFSVAETRPLLERAINETHQN